MDRTSYKFIISPIIVFCLIVVVINSFASEMGGKHALVSEKSIPISHVERKNVCQISHPCLEVLGNITTQNIKVEKEGRFSQVGIGLPKNHAILNALEVNGTILAEEILVQAKVADYVFSPTYDLKSLEFVEGFIYENHHLPGIPSKSTIENAGGEIPLGDAYRLLLEKIEELTLYSIEQNKRIAVLESLLARQSELIPAFQEEH